MGLLPRWQSPSFQFDSKDEGTRSKAFETTQKLMDKIDYGLPPDHCSKGESILTNMLVEKKYPLIKELLEKILNLQLEAEEESTLAFELIKSMLEE
ncbi:hypothetical protein Tco_1528907 [Tanacetum coccineum]